jgi:hypothetical protein
MMSAKTSKTQKCQDIDYLKGHFVPGHRRPYSFLFSFDTLNYHKRYKEGTKWNKILEKKL